MAQLGARRNGIAEVAGSTPARSTKKESARWESESQRAGGPLTNVAGGFRAMDKHTKELVALAVCLMLAALYWGVIGR